MYLTQLWGSPKYRHMFDKFVFKLEETNFLGKFPEQHQSLGIYEK